MKTGSAPLEWGSSSLAAGGWASLRTSLNSLGACQWRGGFPCRNLPALTPTPSDSWGLCVPSVGSHPGHCPSGGHDATLLALDLKELSHAGEIFLIGLGHLLLSCLWVHNLQALGREGRQDDGETTWPLTTPPTPRVNRQSSRSRGGEGAFLTLVGRPGRYLERGEGHAGGSP